MAKPKKTKCEYCGKTIIQVRMGRTRNYCTASRRTLGWMLRKAIRNAGRFPLDRTKSKR